MLTGLLAPWRRHRFHALLLCGQIALIAWASRAQWGTQAWLAALGLALLSALGWLRALSTLRQITDTPVSRIASAAQGFVALRGQALAVGGLPLVSPLNGLPVLWYRLNTEERQGDSWTDTGTDESEDSFLLQDDTGICAIDPVGAEIHALHRECETRGDMRYTQWCVMAGDSLHVLGAFRTLHGESLTRTERAAVSEILAEWKQDRAGLLRRFDRDGDGELSEQEWEAARSDAQHEARRQRSEADQAACLHVLRKPASPQPFIVSAVKPWRLKLPHYSWCALNAALFLLACAGINALAQTGSVVLF